MAPYTIVITGANRGLGLELAKQLSSRPNVLIIGTARNPSTATELASLSNVKVVGMDMGDYSSIAKAAEEIAQLTPTGLDELWNNAATCNLDYSPTQTPADVLLEVLRINTVSPTVVTQSLLPQLKMKEKGARKVFFVTSNVGSLGNMSSRVTEEDVPGGWPWSKSMSYAASKAALSMVALNIWGELRKEGFIVGILHPGWVKTDMGGDGAMLTKEESIAGLLKVTSELKKDDPIRVLDWAGKIVEA